jgi:hypothetical protein
VRGVELTAESAQGRRNRIGTVLVRRVGAVGDVEDDAGREGRDTGGGEQDAPDASHPTGGAEAANGTADREPADVRDA